MNKLMGKFQTRKKQKNNHKKILTKKQKGGMESLLLASNIANTFFSVHMSLLLGTYTLKKIFGLKKDEIYKNRPELVNVVSCHGNLLAGDEIEIPSGINIITMVNHGKYNWNSSRLGPILFNFLIDIDLDPNLIGINSFLTPIICYFLGFLKLNLNNWELRIKIIYLIIILIIYSSTKFLFYGWTITFFDVISIIINSLLVLFVLLSINRYYYKGKLIR